MDKVYVIVNASNGEFGGRAYADFKVAEQVYNELVKFACNVNSYYIKELEIYK